MIRRHPWRDEGFTLVEAMVVLMIIMILASITIPVTADRIARAKADSTSREALAWLEDARNRASSERRNFEVLFDLDRNRIRIQRIEPNLARTPILDRELPDEVEFMRFSGIPDTPEKFGAASDIDLDGPAPHMFTSDGSFIDANGDPSNGTIFLGKPKQRESARAITFFGVTGLVRTWKWSGAQWNQ